MMDSPAWLRAALALALCCAGDSGAQAPGGDQRGGGAAEPPAVRASAPATSLLTRLDLRRGLLEDLGLRIESGAPTSGFELHPHSPSGAAAAASAPEAGGRGAAVFTAVDEAPGQAANGLTILFSDDGGFASLAGVARHREGLSIEVLPFREVQPEVVPGLTLRAVPEAGELEILSAAGEVLLWGRILHAELAKTAGRLRIFGVDLRIAPRLAAKLREPDSADAFVGTLDLEARFAPSLAPRPGDPQRRCRPRRRGEVDLAIADILSVDSVRRGPEEAAGELQGEEAEGRLVEIAPSLLLENVGRAEIPWRSPFAAADRPAGEGSSLPLVVWSLARLRGGRVEQLAVSGVHGASGVSEGLAIPECADARSACRGGGLAPGCRLELPTASLDHGPLLAPRHEVLASEALRVGGGTGGARAQPLRLMVRDAQLETANARYFLQAQVLTPGDANPLNSVAYAEVQPTRVVSGGWVFPIVGEARAGTVLDAWAGNAGVGEGSVNVASSGPAGSLQVAARSWALDEERSRYELAVFNRDFDPGVLSIEMPAASPGPKPEDFGFHDADRDPGNDWSAVLEEDGFLSLRRPRPAGGEAPEPATALLAWGAIHSFGWTYRGEPAAGTLLMEAGARGEDRSVEAMTPGQGPLIFRDDFESGGVEAWR
ncbi:MAG: hypothetical protein AAF725_19520 [Acidobacteriota bacterium]